MSTVEVPAYFTNLINAWYQGEVGRCAHLGHWEPSPDTPAVQLPAGPARTIEFQRAQQRMDTVLLTMAELTAGQSVLDVGCGFGGLLERINAEYAMMDLVGINIDARQLRICESLPPQQGNTLRWVHGDACVLPFADQCFDCVFCVEAMFHFSSRRQFLQEAARVLKPGGRLIGSDIQLVDPVDADNHLPRFAIQALLNDGYGPWPDPWTELGTVPQLCRAAGLTEIEVVDATARTLPSYQFILPPRWTEQHDPGDAAARSALMLHWLHQHGQLRYVYFRAS